MEYKATTDKTNTKIGCKISCIIGNGIKPYGLKGCPSREENDAWNKMQNKSEHYTENHTKQESHKGRFLAEWLFLLPNLLEYSGKTDHRISDNIIQKNYCNSHSCGCCVLNIVKTDKTFFLNNIIRAQKFSFKTIKFI